MYNSMILDLFGDCDGIVGKAIKKCYSKASFEEWWGNYHADTLVNREQYSFLHPQGPRGADDWRKVPSPYAI